jgi:iron complex transport system substrate-binding protein
LREDKIVVLALVLLANIIPLSSGSGYVLHVFGNANMDGTIDREDIDTLREIINNSISPTYLADANLDGEVDLRDIAL